jgi:predicted Zn-dependent protease
VNRYINVLGDSIARLTERPDLPWTFYVVNAKEINAFVVPGGYIYVNRGLIEHTQNLSQLAGVLGHEIGHVVKRHSIKQMNEMNAAQVGVGQTAINVAGTAVFAKFSRDDEREADDVGIDNVVRAHIHPKGIPEMFQILLDTRTSNPGLVDGWFASHPTEEDRIHDTQAKINMINPAVLRTLTIDSQGFQNFKARVRSLPQPR